MAEYALFLEEVDWPYQVLPDDWADATLRMRRFGVSGDLVLLLTYRNGMHVIDDGTLDGMNVLANSLPTA